MDDNPLRRRIFLYISSKIISKEWKFLGRNLELDEPELDTIYTDCYNRGNGIRDVYYKMLEQWHNSFADKVTLPKLLNALVDINRRDIAQGVQQTEAEYQVEQLNAPPIQPAPPTVPHNASNTRQRGAGAVPRPRTTGTEIVDSPPPPQQHTGQQERAANESATEGQDSVRRLLSSFVPTRTKIGITSAFLVFVAVTYASSGSEGVQNIIDGFLEFLRYLADPRNVGYLFGKLIFWF